MRSDLDVAVDNVSDEEYNAAVESSLHTIETQLRKEGRFPNLIFFQAGVDPLKEDRLGRLNISREVRKRAALDILVIAKIVVFIIHTPLAVQQDILHHFFLFYPKGLQKRNDIVLSFCEAANVPLVILMGGGYSRPIGPTAAAHCDVFMQASESFLKRVRSAQK
jgi:acetoin utilization deacetylase AcuC-like enzyme